MPRDPDSISANGTRRVEWRGKWCFTRKHLSRPWNRYAYFRRTVDLPAEPRRAVVRVSADARYTLYVNGRRIHHGPARSYQRFQSFDTLDITDALESGRNVIAAIVHQYGIPTFQSQYADISGFLVDGEIEMEHTAAMPLHTPDGWLCRPCEAWRQDVVRRSIQLGFQEHFDADADPNGWMRAEFEPRPEAGWQAPWVAGPPGIGPWLCMEDRGVPLLADRVEDFAAVVSQFTGENARGYKIAPDVYHVPAQEHRKREPNLIDDVEKMLRDDAAVSTVAPPAAGSYVSVVLDLGQYRTGHLMLDIVDAAGDEIIDLIYAEEIEKSGFPLLAPESSHCEEATADRYRCRAGAQSWETFHFNGMRYVMLVFRNVTKPLQVRHVAIRQVQTAMEDAGRFECSDERLNRIWQVARETQRNCMFDAFVDCPWREQAMWWGDARVQSRVTLHAFGDLSLLERGIRLVARSQADDGSLHAHPPSDLPGHRLPDFMLTWVASLWDWHFHTGRTDLVRECLPVMHRLFKFFEAHESPQGLIGSFDGWWVFLDWADLHRTDFSAVLNLLYLQARRHAVGLCRVAGDEAGALRHQSKADLLTSAVGRHFWDRDEKLWRDGFDSANGKSVEQVSQHANTLALLLNLQPEHRVRIARECLLKPAEARKSKVVTASPFFYAYILEALIECGLREEAIGLIRDKWGQMLDRGATTFWELWEVTTQSRCHAWSSSPLYHLSEQVLGVMPVEPGWRRVRIAPVCGKLDFARGVVPAPPGVISVDWETAGDDQLAVRVELPPGVRGDFVSPSGQTRALAEGVQEFQA